MNKLRTLLLFVLLMSLGKFSYSQNQETLKINFQNNSLSLYCHSNWYQDGLSMWIDTLGGTQSCNADNYSGYLHLYPGVMYTDFFSFGSALEGIRVIYINNHPNSTHFDIYDANHDLMVHEASSQIGEIDTFQYTFLSQGHKLKISGEDVSIFSIELLYTPVISQSAEEVCAGEEISFRFDFPNTRLIWNFGDGTSAEGYEVKHKYESNGTYDVSLIVGNKDFSVDTLFGVVIVNDAAIPKVSISSVFGFYACPNEEVLFKTDTKANEYLWTIGGKSFTTSEPYTKYAFPATGQAIAKLTVANACGNEASDSATVIIESNRPANADFYPSSYEVCPFDNISFSPSSAGYTLWNFGDGNTSSERFAIHNYADTGTYQVTLISKNGCGALDTTSKWVNVNYNYNFFPDIAIGYEGDDYTSSVCIGTTIKFNNYTYIQNNQTYYWRIYKNEDIQNAVYYNALEPTHTFTEQGSYTIEFKLRDNCGGEGYNSLSIYVDNSAIPQTYFIAVPDKICPGETVYFLDGFFDPARKIKYKIDFEGDGSIDDSTFTLTVNKPNVLFKHTYLATGDYSPVLQAFNECGNYHESFSYISVIDDPNSYPTYYLENSAAVVSEFGMDDFGLKQSNSDFVFHLPIVDFPGYDSTSMTKQFYAFVYSDGLDTSQLQYSNYQPIGYAKGNMKNGITLYIPASLQLSSIGLLGAWYCEGMPMGQGPTSHAIPTNFAGDLLLSFPVEYETSIDLTNFESNGLAFTPYNGTCTSSAVVGTFVSNDGLFIQFENSFFKIGKKWADGKYEFYDEGYIFADETDTSFYFSSNGLYPNNCATSSGKYRLHIEDGVLTFESLIDDQCPSRSDIITQRAFHYVKMANPGAVCPSDPIELNVYGGKNVVWKIEGNTIPLNPTLYAFSTTGIKEASAIVTNFCGRHDTLYTYVEVSNKALPNPEFYINRSNFKVSDHIILYPKELEFEKQSGTYNWDFGDGTTSTEKIPTHKYENPGEYMITLVVTNGCGKASSSNWVKVNPEEKCLANFNFVIDYNTDSVSFDNYSLGAANEYIWTFGDGFKSTDRNPIHYYTKSGLFKVCLSIRDTSTNCVDQVCKEIQIGNSLCFADFTYFMNEATNEVSFYSNATVENGKYYWDFGNGYYSYDANPVHTFNDGYYWVCLMVYDTISGCYADRCMEIQVGNSGCKISYSYYFTDSYTAEFYSNFSISSDTTNENSTQQYYWDFGDGSSDNIANPVHTFANPGYYNTCLYFYDSISNCYSQYCMPIVINGGDSVAVCKASFTYFADTASLAVSFTDKSFNTATQFYWDFGDGNISTEQNPTHNYAATGNYWVYFATYDSISLCYSDYSQDVFLNNSAEARCQANFSYLFDEETATLKLQNKSTGNPNLFYYDFGDGQYAYTENPTHIYSAAGQYNVCLYTYNESTQCYDDFCQLISVKQGGVATCDANFSIFVNPDSLRLTAVNKSSGNITNYYWTFGDGTYDLVGNARHQYEYPGVYTVCLYVYDANTDCYDEQCEEVKVGNDTCNITADFSYFVDVQNNKVNFFSKASGMVNAHYWDFGDGSTSSETQPVYQYAKPGFYYVTMAAYNAQNGCIDFAWQQVQVGTPECKAHFTYRVDVATNTVKFSNDSKDAAIAYWGFGDGGYSQEMEPEYQFAQPGKYWVGMVIVDQTGTCYDYYEEIVQVGEVTCSAKFETFVDINTLSVSFKNASIGEATQLYWVFGDGGYDTVQNPVHKYNFPGYYYAGLYTYNAATNCMDYAEKLLLVGEEGKDCEAIFYYKADPTTRNVQFTDNSRGNVVSYVWDFGDGTTSTDKSPVHTYTNTGWYYVCLTVTNDQGITNMTCMDVQVGEGCRANYIYSLDNVSRTVKFHDQSFGTPTEWKWNFGDSTSLSTEQNPTHVFEKPGYYVVQLDIKNANACEATYVTMFSVGVDDASLTAGFAFVVDSTGSKPSGYPVDYYGTSNGNTSKSKWTFGAGKAGGKAENETTLRPSYVYTEAGTYQVCLTIEDPNTGQTSTTCSYVKVGTVGLDDKAKMLSISLFPNPAESSTRLQYTLQQAGDVKIEVYNATSTQVMESINEYRNAGENSTDIDISRLSSGIYYVHITSPSGTAVEKLIVK